MYVCVCICVDIYKTLLYSNRLAPSLILAGEDASSYVRVDIDIYKALLYSNFSLSISITHTHTHTHTHTRTRLLASLFFYSSVPSAELSLSLSR